MATTSGNGPRGPGMSHLIPYMPWRFVLRCAVRAVLLWGGHGPFLASSPECREARARHEAQGPH